MASAQVPSGAARRDMPIPGLCDVPGPASVAVECAHLGETHGPKLIPTVHPHGLITFAECDQGVNMWSLCAQRFESECNENVTIDFGRKCVEPLAKFASRPGIPNVGKPECQRYEPLPFCKVVDKRAGPEPALPLRRVSLGPLPLDLWRKRHVDAVEGGTQRIGRVCAHPRQQGHGGRLTRSGSNHSIRRQCAPRPADGVPYTLGESSPRN